MFTQNILSSIFGTRRRRKSLSMRSRRSTRFEALEDRRLMTGTPSNLQELFAFDASSSAEFGKSIDMAGDYAVIGSYKADVVTRNAGAAYVYKRVADDDWDHVVTLVASDAGRNDEFGSAVAIEKNGTDSYTVAVGAPHADGARSDTGALYVFEGSGTTWNQVAKLAASNGKKGDQLAVSSGSLEIEGDVIVVGAQRADAAGTFSGSAYVFEKAASGWADATQSEIHSHDLSADDQFGISVDINDGTVVIGGNGSNAAYVFEDNGSGWAQKAKLVHSGGGDTSFGWSVAISDQTIAVTKQGEVSLFDRPAGGWTDASETLQLPKPTTAGGFGWSVDLATDPNDAGKDYLAIGAIHDTDHAAYVFHGSGMNWTETSKLIDPDQAGNHGFDVVTDGRLVLSGDNLDNVEAHPSGPYSSGGSVYVFPVEAGPPPPPSPGITVIATSGLVTSEDGASAQFTVALNTQPTADVTIDLSSSNVLEGQLQDANAITGVLTLTFTPSDWNIDQAVTVLGVDDSALDGDVAYTIRTDLSSSADANYNGIDAADVSVTNLDNEGAPAVTIDSISPSTVIAGTTTTIEIFGTGFEDGATVQFVNGSGPAPVVDNIVYDAETGSLMVTITVSGKGRKGTRLWDVVVTNPDASSDTLEDGLTVTKS